MKWNFPVIRTTRTVEQQFEKIKDECSEYEESFDEQDLDEEAIDILHSVETFLRLRFKGRENELENLIQRTILKNTKRGYYEQNCY